MRNYETPEIRISIFNSNEEVLTASAAEPTTKVETTTTKNVINLPDDDWE